MSDIESAMLDSIALGRQGARRGRAEATMFYVRDLDESDREELENPTPTGREFGYNSMNGAGLKRLRHTHHLLAMVLAEGASHSQASALTGYSPNTINLLNQDPAFKDLIAHYRTATMAEFEDIRRRAASLGLSFLDELQERLEETPETFTNKEVKECASMLLDRTILPSKTNSAPAAPSAPAVFSAEITFISASPQEHVAPAPRTIDLTPSTPKELSSDENP